jgi:hypothetical protein
VAEGRRGCDGGRNPSTAPLTDRRIARAPVVRRHARRRRCPTWPRGCQHLVIEADRACHRGRRGRRDCERLARTDVGQRVRGDHARVARVRVAGCEDDRPAASTESGLEIGVGLIMVRVVPVRIRVVPVHWFRTLRRMRSTGCMRLSSKSGMTRSIRPALGVAGVSSDMCLYARAQNRHRCKGIVYPANDQSTE